jgi:hypothetical protein
LPLMLFAAALPSLPRLQDIVLVAMVVLLHLVVI